MSSNVEKIKERINIADVVGSYVKLEKAGTNFKGKCPFHSEKTPSFFISPDRGTYYCFGCGAKGDIFSFVQEFEGLDFLGALKVLAARAGVELQKENTENRSEKERLLQIVETATLFFEREIENNKEALEYLKKRGMTEKTLKEWRIGFSPLSFDKTSNYLKGKGFSQDELHRVGLIKKHPEKGSFYDVFRGRIMFPIFDSAGRPIAFSGRILKEDEKSPKYLNSPETVLFNKSEVLYGFHQAKTAIRKKNYSVLVEGQMDLVMSHQGGFDNTVASSGTSLTLSQLSRLNRLSNRIILSFDGDGAGFKAMEKGTKMALSLGMNVRIAALPSSEDPASVISKDKDKYFSFLKNSMHIIDFYLDKLVSSKLSDRQKDQEVKKRILPFVKILPSKIDQSRFIQDIAEKTGVKENALWEDLEKIFVDEDVEEETAVEKERVFNRKNSIAFRILGILLWQEGGDGKGVDIQGLKNKVKDVVGEEVIKDLLDKKDEAIFEAESYYSGAEDLNKILEDLFFNLEEEVLKNQFTDIMRKLTLAEKASNKEETQKLLIECQEISKKINDLNAKKAI